MAAAFWTEGVPIRSSARDPQIEVGRSAAAITIDMRGGNKGAHFNGVVSTLPHDLSTLAASVLVVQAPQGGGRTRFAVVADDRNWYGMSVVDTTLLLEKCVEGKLSARSIPYDQALHRYWRLHKSGLTPLFVWETSADGTHWEVQLAEPPEIQLSSVVISLSAGTESAVSHPGIAIFSDFRLKGLE